MVEDVKGFTVHVKQLGFFFLSSITDWCYQRYDKLKGEQKPKKCRITDLEKQVKALTDEAKVLADEKKDENAKMHRW